MWSGRKALSNIDQTLQTIRNEVVRLDSQLTQLTDSLTAGKRHRLKLINDIAGVRLAAIESGKLAAGLNAADLQAVEILQQRDAALNALTEEITRIDQSIAEAEQQRAALLERVNATSQEIVDIEAAVQTALQLDQAYMQQFAKASTAQSISEEAERKVEQAQADMAEKAEPYQQDELFMYLWQRGYGTTAYQGRLFARFMDSWVARIIKYEPARINYWNLTEIPLRLTEHADRVAELADEEHMALQQLELDALQQAGHKDLNQKLEGLRAELDEHDDQLEATEADLNTKLEQRAGFVAGEDEYLQQCLARLTQALDHQDLREVHRYVQATHSPTDDQLVLELQSLDDRMEQVNGDLSDVRQLHDNKLSKLKELESVRRNFKNSRYDDVRSGFGNEALLATVLGQFLQGVVSGSDLWRTLQRHQQYRNVGSIPDFGSDGLGGLGDLLGGGSLGGVGGEQVGRRRRPRTHRSSTWNWPQPRRGGGGFRIPRGGGGGGGGFKTGGGF